MSNQHHTTINSGRRQEANLPSVKRHVFRAVSILALCSAGFAFGYHFLGNPNDAASTGAVNIVEAPMPAASDNLEGTGTDVPDLLNGIVDEGVNPTEQLDVLGNPVAGTDGGLAGGEQQVERPVETIANIQPSSGPKTIMIDGKPIGGSFPTSALPRAPFADIVRNTPFGGAPTVSPSGNKALKAYARPFNPAAGKKQVAIIIGGLGIDRNLTRRVIKDLPPEVTLSFAAHTNGLQTWIHQARERGHEVIIELPMEGHNFNPAEPGAGRALKTDASAAVNVRNLDWLMSRAQGYFAVTNYNGGKIVENQQAILPILQHLSNSGVGFIYDGSDQASGLSGLASSANLTYQKAYTIIDTNSEFSLIQSELTNLEVASSSSPQIGVGFALPETVLAVDSWVKGLDAKGMELAPASYVLNR